VEEYRELLLDLGNLKLNIDLNEVYEYYYMQFINSTKNWLYNDYDRFVSEIGGYIRQIEPVAYEKFLDELTPEKHERILTCLENFIESGDFWLQFKHYAAGNNPSEVTQ
jgi:hypothetical protein